MPVDPMEILHTGGSMYPTLKSLDRLHIVSCGERGIRCGDIIVFHPPGSSRTVTHRVVAANGRELVTRGDNCAGADEWILGMEDVIGRVVCAHRGKKRVRVWDGRIGRVNALLLRPLPVSRSVLKALLLPAYLLVTRAGVFRGLFSALLKPRYVVYRRPAGAGCQLVIGRCVIGSYSSGETHWKIRPPFRLFIDEGALPLDLSTSDRTVDGSLSNDSIPCARDDHESRR